MEEAIEETTLADCEPDAFRNNIANGSFSISQGRSKVVFVKDNTNGVFKCHLCPYQTVYKSSMRSHYAVHSNARPYACDLCRYEAKRLCDLKKHKVLKHGQCLKSLRKNQWRGTLGDAAFKQGPNELDQTDDDGFKDIDLDMTSNMAMSRSGVPIEIVDDEDDEDSLAFSDDPNFNMTPNSTFPNINSTSPAEDSCTHGGRSTPTYSEHSSNQNTNADDTRTEREILPRIKREPDDCVDYFSKHYFEGIDIDNEEETTDLSQDRSSDGFNKYKESGYSSGQESDKNKTRNNSASNVEGTGTLSGDETKPFSHHPQEYQTAGSRIFTDSSSNQQSLAKSPPPGINTSVTKQKKSWHCGHCNIVYYDSALFFMHSGLHNASDPWKCNLCGHQFHDVYGFTSHFINGHAVNS